MVAVSLKKSGSYADSLENCGKSQNKLLEAFDHECACSSAQVPAKILHKYFSSSAWHN